MIDNPYLLMTMSWLLTYAVHSTVLLVAGLLILRWSSLFSDTLRSWLWKLALFGGLLTATLQVVMGVDPVGGRVNISGLAAVEKAGESAVVYLGVEEHSLPVLGQPLARLQPVGEEAILEGGTDRGMGTVLGLSLVGIYVLMVGCLLVRLFWSWLALMRRIGDRQEIGHGALPGMLLDLCRQAGIERPIRLTSSERIQVPLAFGIFRQEITLPARSLTALTPAEQAGMLAHELGHLARRDPFWLVTMRLVESFFWWQPLNRLGRQRWLDLAEFRADAWAVGLLGKSLPLARCLTEVVGWTIANKTKRVGAPVLAMAQHRSILAKRVNRLLSGAPRIEKLTGRGLLLLTGLLIMLITNTVPAFSLTGPGVGSLERVDGPNLSTGRLEAVLERSRPEDPSTGLRVQMELLELEVRSLRDLGERVGLTEESADMLRRAEILLQRIQQKSSTILKGIAKENHSSETPEGKGR